MSDEVHVTEVAHTERPLSGSLQLRIQSLGAKCANIECPNKTGDGAFSIVQFAEGPIVQGKRNITVLFCAPCAISLRKATTGA